MKNLYRHFYKRLRVPNIATDTNVHLLNAAELKAINRLEWGAMIVLGIIGTVAVLLLYLPQYQFWREHKRIDIFHKKGILELSVSDIVTLKKDFFEGRGISQLVDKYLN